MNERPSSHWERQFTASIPAIYDSHLGPFLFERYAEDLARRVTVAPSERSAVLEVAAGTGILTAQLRSHLGPDSQIMVTDVSAPMLKVARRRMDKRGFDEPNRWGIADASALPFSNGAFDAVICQFGVMFFPDKERAASETYRVLRTGGQWLFSVWDSWDENVFGRIVHETVAKFFPHDPPGFYHGPFGFYDPIALRTLVTTAGFTDPEIVTLDMVLETESAAHAAIGFVRGNPLIDAIEKRGVVDANPIVDAVAEALARAFGDHPLRIPTRVRVVSSHRGR